MILRSVDGTPLEQLSRSNNRRVICQCDTCGKETSTAYYNYVRAQRAYGLEGKTFCRPCALKRRPIYFGEKAGRWKGGINKPDKKGLIRVYKPSANRKERRVFQYVAIMEEHLGRDLLPTECVHHIDGNRKNNELSNLVILDNVAHKRLHHQLERVGYDLIRAGLIAFDRETNSYKIADKLLSLVGNYPLDLDQDLTGLSGGGVIIGV